MHPDVRSGMGKMAVGYGLSEAVPGPMKWPVRAVTMYPGIRQVTRGLTNPEAYTAEAINELPTIKPPTPQGPETPPAIFGDPQGFAKLPPNVQEAILKGSSQSPGPSAPKPEYTPRPPSYYGVTPTEPEAAPTTKPITPPPATVDIGATLDKLRAQEGLAPGEHLGEVPGAHYPERFAGSDSPVMRPSKAKYIRVNPEELGVHGGVEGTPIKGPLNTPEKIRIARELANELKKSSKGGK